RQVHGPKVLPGLAEQRGFTPALRRQRADAVARGGADTRVRAATRAAVADDAHRPGRAGGAGVAALKGVTKRIARTRTTAAQHREAVAVGVRSAVGEPDAAIARWATAAAVCDVRREARQRLTAWVTTGLPGSTARGVGSGP